MRTESCETAFRKSIQDSCFTKCDMHTILGLLLALVAAVAAFSNNDFFERSAKWIPSGGAGLVSGRGNFRPGFTGRDWRSALAEPSFKKRSVDSWFSEDY